ncbi:MAG TPA: hypothetical protein VFZ18_02300, partial [Longimicrobiaceae bacterium]
GLRTAEGVGWEEATDVQRDLAALWEGTGWAVVAGGRIRLTAAGWLLLDRLAVDFAAAGEVSGDAPSARAR